MCRRPIKLFVISIVLLLLFVFPLFSGCGEDEAKQLDSTKISEYNKPGTVLIETFWEADVTVPEITLNEDALIAYLLNQITIGAIPLDATEEDLVAAAIAELLTNPSLYLIPDVTSKSMPMEMSTFGSGFIVTEDGYIVTNAHLVKQSDDELAKGFAKGSLSEFLAADLAELETALDMDLSTEYEDRILAAAANIYVDYMSISEPTSETKMYMVGIPNWSESGVVAEVVEVGDPMDIQEETGKDVAVLKVNATNLPTVPVGSEADVRDGEQVVALGYPAVATFDSMLDLTAQELKPTLTQGVISAKKTTSGGYDVIQTDAYISNGSSGSPLFNTKGEAIAVNTYGVGEISEATGEYQEKAGYNFAMPASVVTEFLGRANVTPATGALTQKYHDAVDLYFEEHYSAAKKKFKEIQDAKADFPYVQEFIESSTSKIDQGQDKGTFPTWLLIVIIAVVVLGAIAAVVVLILVLKGRGGKQPPAATAVPPGPATPAPEPAAPPAPEPAAPAPEPEAPAPPEPEAAAPAEEAATTEMPAPAAAPEEEAPAETAEEHNFCSKCGTQLDPEGEFCSKCGHPVHE